MSGSSTLKFKNSSLERVNLELSDVLTLELDKLMHGKLSSELDQFDAPISSSGSIYAKNSRFRQVRNLSSNKSSWSNSSIESDILVKSDNELFSSNIPRLTFNDTQVHGNISFTQTKGLVILNGNSKIMGKVLSAAIQPAQN